MLTHNADLVGLKHRFNPKSNFRPQKLSQPFEKQTPCQKQRTYELLVNVNIDRSIHFNPKWTIDWEEFGQITFCKLLKALAERMGKKTLE